MKQKQLEALRDRLAKATGPDRSIDAEITRYFDLWEPGLSVPKFTASLDAAVTLVPEGFGWTVDCRGVVGERPWAEIREMQTWLPHQAASATPALALCLARVEYEIAKAKGGSA